MESWDCLDGSSRRSLRKRPSGFGRPWAKLQGAAQGHPGGSETPPYTLTRNDALDATLPLHSGVVLDDPSGIGEKAWTFSTTLGPSYPCVTRYEERPSATLASQPLLRKDYTWVNDSAGNPYISAVVTTNDPTGANWQVETDQTVDIHGNVTQSTLGVPAGAHRSYNSTYITDPNYTSRYIFNRLLTAQVTDNVSQNFTLVTNTYDNQSLSNISSLREHDSSYGTSFVYRGNVSVTTPLGSPSQTVQSDITGTAVSITDGLGHTLAITSSSANNYAVPSAITPNSNTNLQTSGTYTPWLAQASVTQPNAVVTLNQYDPTFGRLTQSTSVYGAVTNYTYAQNGSLPMVTTAMTDGHWVQTTLDGFGRATSVVRGNGSTTVSTVNTVYAAYACSPLGKVAKLSQPYAPSGTVYWTVYTYDGMERTISVVSPDGASTTTTAYSGNTTTITDPAGKWKKQTFGTAGNMIQVNEPNPAGGADYVTNYTYTLLDRLTTVTITRPTGTQTHTFSYDPTTQRLSSETHPETGTTSYTYNTDSTLATKIDAKNQKVAYSYDPYQRILTVQRYPVSTGAADPCQTATYTWDAAAPIPGFGFGPYAWGHLSQVQWNLQADGVTPCNNGAFTEMYAYNQNGTVSAKALQYANVPALGQPPVSGMLIAQYGYDDQGKVTSLVYPNDWPNPNTNYYQYLYTEEGLGRINELQMLTCPNAVCPPSGTVLVNPAVYGPSNEITSLTYLGYTETRTYNSLVQMTRQTATGTGLPSVDLEYVFSPTANNGQITQGINHVSGETVSYTYDSLKRLGTAGSATWGLSFSYDGFGNRLAQTQTLGSPPHATFNYSATNNQIITAGYTYDANGNLTALPGVGALTYDVENRMVGDPTSSYVYGQDGRRIFASSVGYIHFYGIEGWELGSYAPALNSGQNGWTFATQTKYVYFNGRLIQSSVGATAGQVVVADRLGSVRAKGKTATYSYYPFGEEYTTTAQGIYKFGSYYRDGTGLDYAQNRYYSSIMGRFLTPDPSSRSMNSTNPASFNRYAYTGGEPVNRSDPSGLGNPGGSGGCLWDGSDGPVICNPIDNGPTDTPCLTDGFDSAPDPGCGTLSPTQQPSPSQPSFGPPPPPTCEIGLFYRKAFNRHLFWNHTYLADLCTYANGVTMEDTIQADPGPVPKWPNVPTAPPGYLGTPWLVGVIGPIGSGPGHSNPNASGNYQVGSWEQISYNDLLSIRCAVRYYDYNFVQPYVLFPWNKTTYNSNSFVSTLDENYDLGFVPPRGTRRGPFNATPGWGNPVPNLGPSLACPL